MQLKYILERLDWLENYIGFRTHVAINNAMGGNMEMISFDQWVHCKHLDHIQSPDAVVIPDITDPLGKYWDQPSNRFIYIDDKVARMDQKSFDQLNDYSHSQPSGVCSGKMWKGQYQSGEWYLAFYGPHPSPGYCSNNYRLIEIFPERNYRYEYDEKRTLTILN